MLHAPPRLALPCPGGLPHLSRRPARGLQALRCPPGLQRVAVTTLKGRPSDAPARQFPAIDPGRPVTIQLFAGATLLANEVGCGGAALAIR
jgi:hypothetical protein